MKNISDGPLDNVTAVARWFTFNDQFITSDSALIEFTPILAGQTSPFEVLTPANPAMRQCSIDFKFLLGGTIETER